MSDLPRTFKTVSEYRVARSSGIALAPSLAHSGVAVTIIPDEQVQSIQEALNLFDAQSGVAEADASRVAHDAGEGMTQFITLPAEPQETRFVHSPDERRREDLSGGAFIEYNASGQITRTRSCSGDIAMFSYDVQRLVERFSYAGLDWRREAASEWTAQDRQSDFKIDGMVEVLADGSIRVSRQDMCRVVRLSGMRIDEYTNGSQSESRKIKNSASPYDILAKAKPVGSVWRTPGGKLPAQTAETKLKLENLFREPSAERIPEAACTTALAALMDASADVPLPESDEPTTQLVTEGALTTVKRHTSECFNKAAVWICDKVKGNGSAEQLPYLDNLAEIYMHKKQFDLAELTYLRSLNIKEQFYGLRQPELASNLFGLGQVHREWGNLQRAEQFFQQALELFDKGVRKQMFLLTHSMSAPERVRPTVESMIECIMALFTLYEGQMKISAGTKLCGKALGFWAEMAEKNSGSGSDSLLALIESHVIELSYKGSEAFGFQRRSS